MVTPRFFNETGSGKKTGELDTLNAYMSGMKFMEITRFMNVDHTTIWRRMQNVRKKYVKATGAV